MKVVDTEADEETGTPTFCVFILEVLARELLGGHIAGIIEVMRVMGVASVLVLLAGTSAGLTSTSSASVEEKKQII